MAELKTKVNDGSVADFINAVSDDKKRADSFELLTLFEKVTHEKPKMWGSSIIGFGSYHYKSERSTQEGDWPLVAFSPRKQNISLYLMIQTFNAQSLLEKLGKYKAGKGCIYINKLTDVDKKVLEQLIERSFEEMKKRYLAVS
ncbi:DUF1801 domain-containing protein [candidate division WWE3 bacterium]|nr:DUF1801 domain-containing protein [candidate division WWE3 bacterium]